MSSSKIAISLDSSLLARLDRLVRSSVFPSRSRAIQDALEEKMARLERARLARECAKLKRSEEQKLAEEGMSAELEQWPEY